MTGCIVAVSSLAVIAAVIAVALSDMRKTIMASWVASMSAGALFLAYGAEYLAVVQWTIGTLIAISFLVYASLFGEYAAIDKRVGRKKAFDAIPALVIGGSFLAIVSIAIFGKSVGSDGPVLDLAATGQSLAERHLISLELIAFLLLAVLIGAGVIGRAETFESDGSK